MVDEEDEWFKQHSYLYFKAHPPPLAASDYFIVTFASFSTCIQKMRSDTLCAKRQEEHMYRGELKLANEKLEVYLTGEGLLDKVVDLEAGIEHVFAETMQYYNNSISSTNSSHYIFNPHEAMSRDWLELSTVTLYDGSLFKMLQVKSRSKELAIENSYFIDKQKPITGIKAADAF